MKGSAVPGIETGAEEPAQASMTADEAAGRSDTGTGTGTLTGGVGQAPAGQPAGGKPASANGNGSGHVFPSQPAPRPAARPAPGTRPGAQERVVGWLVMAAAPAVTGLIVGGYRIGYPSLWRDEADTKVVVTRSFGQIFALLRHTDAVHGAYYLTMHLAVGIFGASAGALRLPSLIAMSIACAFTAAIGRRLAVMAGAPYATFTGLCAGMVFATAPFMTRYAQEARSYAMVTMLATVATYLLLRAVSDGRRWWLAYAVAIAVTGLVNIFGVLLLVAHGLSLLIAGLRERAAVNRAAAALTRGDIIPSAALPAPGGPGGTRAGDRPGSGQPPLAVFAPAGLSGKRVAGLPVRWLAAGAASAVLIPLVLLAYAQRGQLSWVSRPNFNAIVALAHDGAGSQQLILPVFALAVGGVLAGLIADRSPRPFTPGVVAFPWMVAPPIVLIGVSLIHPMYDERYVEYCLPALAVLVAWGIAWIARLAAATPLSRAGIGWLPSAVVAVGLAALLIPPQKAVRLDSARPENLREASAVIASQKQPGDIIFYIPITGRIASMAYPGPFTSLRDIALAKSPLASATLYGTDVSAPVLRSRFVDVTRVWVVTGVNNYQFPKPTTPVDKEELSMISDMYQIGAWQDGDTLFRLYDNSPRIGVGPAGSTLSRLYRIPG
jgi:mannosyltransferase